MHIAFFFFFNDTATTEIYTLSLHDALPISDQCSPSSDAPQSTGRARQSRPACACPARRPPLVSETFRVSAPWGLDRKSTRLNSSHANISYAVFCLKKKKNKSN